MAPRPIQEVALLHQERPQFSVPSPATALIGKTPQTVKCVSVVPFARALELLGAFTSQDTWLGNRELAERTDLPPSTVSRIAQSLVALGYLHHEPQMRKYRLAPSVLSLGYAAVGSSEVQQVARVHMKAFANENKIDVFLCSRDRLDMVVLESCRGSEEPIELKLRYGVRFGVMSSPMGWALLASLPKQEQSYLLEQFERHPIRDWQRQRRCASEAIPQVQELGFCASTLHTDESMSIVAAPLLVAAQGPIVLACIGATSRMPRARVARELGPRLMTLTQRISQQMENQ